MTVSSKYDPAASENRWYKYWLDNGYFRSKPDEREPYTIVIPPPNVTGVLHMGHMLNNTIQDVLIRRARMQGLNACWVPGTDHASIATEAKVVAKLKSEGVDKRDLSRDEFLKHAWEWTDKHGGIILEQLKRLGASCDWDRTLFTMDEKRYDSVISVFVDLYNKGLIYKGVRMVNWDPEARTAVSDEEVNYTEENSRLYYVNYKIAGEEGFITIATTRPETILGDTAVCANPADGRYEHMKGKRVIVPLVNREVPFIFDDYVEMDFGTGCLKITPAHDINDYEIGIRHNLSSIDIFNDNGTISNEIGIYGGIDRFEAREIAVKDLKESGALGKVEEYVNKVGRSERTNSIIEPKLSMQWFLKMEELSKPALKAVIDGDVEIHPSKYVNVYRHWMENVRDWCISRQLWWGHRIPAWYYNNNEFVVARNENEALSAAQKSSGNPNLKLSDLRQDEDVLDTWFSSWLWPIAAFDGINNPGNSDMEYYYPTNNLITAPEILFFWVARMIIAGYEYTGKKPFSNVYLHGLVRDKQRRKMSKSLGNSPDPLDLIAKYGADGVRVGMLLCSPAGNDLLYDDSLPEQGRNFANKIWNASRLVQGWNSDPDIEQPESSRLAAEWMENALNKTLADIDESFTKFRISDALMITYKLFWDDFSAWYLEAIKPEYGKPIDLKTLNSTLSILDKLLRILHPFMPFITEELWQHISGGEAGKSIMTSPMPVAGHFDVSKLADFDEAREIISAVRNVRKERNLGMKEQLTLLMSAPKGSFISSFYPVIMKLGNLSSLECADKKPDGAISFLVGTREFFIPLEEKFDKEAEIEKLEKELDYFRGFLKSVSGKLSNDRFIASAPAAVVDIERKKKSDAESKITLLENQIASLKGL